MRTCQENKTRWFSKRKVFRVCETNSDILDINEDILRTYISSEKSFNGYHPKRIQTVTGKSINMSGKTNL